MAREIRTTVTVCNDKGLHLKPAQKVVNLASRFAADIKLGWDGQLVEAKSTLGLLALGAGPGSELELRVRGEDAEAAAAALAALFAAGFDPAPGEEVSP